MSPSLLTRALTNMNNFLLSLFIIAQLTGFSLPQIIDDNNLYLVPSYTEDNSLQMRVGILGNDLPLAKKAKAPRIKNQNEELDNLSAKAGIVMDALTGQVLWQKNESASLPIASITKLMTCLVFLDHNPGWETKHKMTGGENSLIGAKLVIDNDQELTMKDLLRVTLVGSANNTAKALADSTGLSNEEFAKAMNKKAEILGLTNSKFVEPTGLDENNKSSAHDLAVILQEVSKHKELRTAMNLTEHKLLIPPDNHEHTVKTTVKLMNDPEVNLLAGKTGFTYEAGYCLATLAKNDDNNEIITIVMGLPSETLRDQENKELINWAFENYIWE